MSVITRTINSFLFNLGYQIHRKGDSPVSAVKFKQLIKEAEGVYKEFLLKDLQLSDDVRLTLLSELLGTNISGALFILDQVQKTLELNGDICEFGVAQGATSALIAYEIRQTNKILYLFDSFQGLQRPTEKDVLINDIWNLGTMEAYEGKMANSVELVKGRLRAIAFPFERVRIVSGFVEESLKYDYLPKKVSFAYVDLDFYEPIRVTLDYLDKVLLPGGTVITGDYGFFSTGSKSAVDEFIASHPNNYEFVLPPTYAGDFCIIKKLM